MVFLHASFDLLLDVQYAPDIEATQTAVGRLPCPQGKFAGISFGSDCDEAIHVQFLHLPQGLEANSLRRSGREVHQSHR
jgi:hypothetical protein